MQIYAYLTDPKMYEINYKRSYNVKIRRPKMFVTNNLTLEKYLITFRTKPMHSLQFAQYSKQHEGRLRMEEK